MHWFMVALNLLLYVYTRQLLIYGLPNIEVVQAIGILASVHHLHALRELQPTHGPYI